MGPAAPSADNQEILGRIPKKGAVPVQAESEKHRANLLLLVWLTMPLRPGRLKKFCSLGSSWHLPGPVLLRWSFPAPDHYPLLGERFYGGRAQLARGSGAKLRALANAALWRFIRWQFPPKSLRGKNVSASRPVKCRFLAAGGPRLRRKGSGGRGGHLGLAAKRGESRRDTAKVGPPRKNEGPFFSAAPNLKSAVVPRLGECGFRRLHPLYDFEVCGVSGSVPHRQKGHRPPRKAASGSRSAGLVDTSPCPLRAFR